MTENMGLAKLAIIQKYLIHHNYDRLFISRDLVSSICQMRVAGKY
jgi:hypothetical protein